MFRICQTREDKLKNARYFQEIRTITSKIRDEYDRAKENRYHYNFYKNVRPDFMEPIPKIVRK